MLGKRILEADGMEGDPPGGVSLWSLDMQRKNYVNEYQGEPIETIYEKLAAQNKVFFAGRSFIK